MIEVCMGNGGKEGMFSSAGAFLVIGSDFGSAC